MRSRSLAVVTCLVAAAACGDNSKPNAPAVADGTTARFAVLETTDLHTNVLSYDYFKLAEDKSLGLERTATLIAQARAELPSSILIDNGDTIQGTVLADYQALISTVPCDQPLAIYKAMNQIGFDVGGIGNHEFNYGLAYLAQVTHTAFDVDGVDTSTARNCAGPDFPQVLANVKSAKTGQTLFPASTIIARPIRATTPDGETIDATLKVGVFAITPPEILAWDKRWLDGKVVTAGVQEVAPPIVSQLRAQGADLVVAIIHGGLDNAPYTPDLENQAWYLAQVPGIDVMLMGHSHQQFPNATSTVGQFSLPMVDKARGTVANVASVMASLWGQHLGVVAMNLVYANGAWSVQADQTVVEARPISTTCTGGMPAACPAGTWQTGAACTYASSCTGQADKTKVFAATDPAIGALVATEHAGAIAYVKTPLGTSDFEMSSLFSDEGEVSAIQIVNEAQADYVKTYVQQNLPQYASLPVISVSAPFKFGFSGGNDYTDVQAGSIAINNAADLYLFANTIYAVKVTGAELKAWLETAATRFQQIDPAVTADQQLINSSQPGYNFDMPTDARLSYEIDVTGPLPATGQQASGRIKNLMWMGAPLDPNAELIVATNNYRASGGGNFPGLDGSKTIYAAPDTSRDVLIRYIKSKGSLTRAIDGNTRSWRFAPVTTAGRVVFSSAQNALAKAQAGGLTNISLVQADDGSGKQLAVYAIDLAH